MNYKTISDNFRYRKCELGYSYETLAEMTGMSKSTLQRYATGNIKNIPLHRLDTLKEETAHDRRKTVCPGTWRHD